MNNPPLLLFTVLDGEKNLTRLFTVLDGKKILTRLFTCSRWEKTRFADFFRLILQQVCMTQSKTWTLFFGKTQTIECLMMKTR